jgi:TonB family protein
VLDAGANGGAAPVARRAGHGFDASALAAIRAYRFSPAEREGRRVRVRMPWTVQFRLR